MPQLLDLATIALIGFTAVVAAWMVVRGLRRTSTLLMLVVGGIIVLAGALQLVSAQESAAAADTKQVTPTSTPVSTSPTPVNPSLAPDLGPVVIHDPAPAPTSKDTPPGHPGGGPPGVAADDSGSKIAAKPQAHNPEKPQTTAATEPTTATSTTKAGAN